MCVIKIAYRCSASIDRFTTIITAAAAAIIKINRKFKNTKRISPIFIHVTMQNAH